MKTKAKKKSPPRSRLFDEVKSREDRRVAERRKEEDRARRNLMPIMVAVCETYRVTPDDIMSSNIHADVVMARNIVVYLGWERCKIGPRILGSILNKDQTHVSKQVSKLKIAMVTKASFYRQVHHVMKRIRAIELGLQARERVTG